MARRKMLTDHDREEISRGRAAGDEQKQIAARIGRDASVVCRRSPGTTAGEGTGPCLPGGPPGQARSRPKARKLDAGPVLRARVTGLLRAGCSPGQAQGRLRYLAGRCEAETMPQTVPAEAIYCWICALPKGELAARGIMLRPGRAERKPRGGGRRPRARGSRA